VEQALRSQGSLHESVLASLVEGIVVQDTSGKIVAFNASALRIATLLQSADRAMYRVKRDPASSALGAA